MYNTHRWATIPDLKQHIQSYISHTTTGTKDGKKKSDYIDNTRTKTTKPWDEQSQQTH